MTDNRLSNNAVETGIDIEDLQDNTHHDRRGNEVGQCDDSLDGLLYLSVRHTVCQKGKDDWKREACQNSIKGNQQRIHQYTAELIGFEELNEPFKTDPGTSEDTRPCLIIFKSNGYL